jgi:hypothetical protein
MRFFRDRSGEGGRAGDQVNKDRSYQVEGGEGHALPRSNGQR